MGDRVDLVAVNYNNSSFTLGMLASLESSLDYLGVIVIVDNASGENDLLALKEGVFNFSIRGLSIEVIESKVNVGYFPGLNLGVEHLRSMRGPQERPVVICNNDLHFSENFFKILMDGRVSDDSIHVVCPSVKTVDGVYQNPSMATPPSSFKKFFYSIYYTNYSIGRALLSLWRGLGFGSNSRRDKDEKEREIFIGIGAVFVLMPGFFEKSSFLDAPTFLYGEEAFLSRQVKRNGGKQLYVPSLEVLHYESVATKKLPGREKYKLTQKAFRLYRDYFFQKEA